MEKINTGVTQPLKIVLCINLIKQYLMIIKKIKKTRVQSTLIDNDYSVFMYIYIYHFLNIKYVRKQLATL